MVPALLTCSLPRHHPRQHRLSPASDPSRYSQGNRGTHIQLSLSLLASWLPAWCYLHEFAVILKTHETFLDGTVICNYLRLLERGNRTESLIFTACLIQFINRFHFFPFLKHGNQAKKSIIFETVP